MSQKKLLDVEVVLHDVEDEAHSNSWRYVIEHVKGFQSGGTYPESSRRRGACIVQYGTAGQYSDSVEPRYQTPRAILVSLCLEMKGASTSTNCGIRCRRRAFRRSFRRGMFGWRINGIVADRKRYRKFRVVRDAQPWWYL